MGGIRRMLSAGLVAAVLVLVSGCAATHVAISKKDLDVQAKTSSAIFVDPVSREKRTIYLTVRSGVMEFDRRAFRSFVADQFTSSEHGYRLVDDPDRAQFHMHVYVLNLEKADPSAAEVALNQGYVGEIAAGAATGALVHRSNPWTGAAVGGLVAGVATTIANAAVKDVTFMLVADVKITEKTREGVIVRKDSKISVTQGEGGSATQRVSEAVDRKEYRTRIVTTANKANLELAEAQDLMFQKTAYAMAGFF